MAVASEAACAGRSAKSGGNGAQHEAEDQQVEAIHGIAEALTDQCLDALRSTVVGPDTSSRSAVAACGLITVGVLSWQVVLGEDALFRRHLRLRRGGKPVAASNPGIASGGSNFRVCLYFTA